PPRLLFSWSPGLARSRRSLVSLSRIPGTRANPRHSSLPLPGTRLTHRHSRRSSTHLPPPRFGLLRLALLP
ncbi:hypothetical protein C0993_001604, partial [Termitomyces sp. T159_Od127]